ncbi:MAG: hypothetical protein AAF587_34740 [Bacteroidota bacterium]
MSQSSSISDQVQKYLANELSEEERLAFEKRFSEEPEFAKEARALLQVEQLILADSMQMRKEAFLREFPQERKQEGPIRFLSWQMSIAASIVILFIGAGVWVWLKQSSAMTSEQLFAAHYEPLRVYTERSGSPDDSLLKGAHRLFHEGKYQASLLEYQKVLLRKNAIDSTQALLFSGFSHMELGQGQQALEYFQMIQSAGAIAHADWYSALAHLQMGNEAEARDALTQILGYQDHYYHTQAKELLQKLQQ